MQYADGGSFRFIHLNILRTFVQITTCLSSIQAYKIYVLTYVSSHIPLLLYSSILLRIFGL